MKQRITISLLIIDILLLLTFCSFDNPKSCRTYIAAPQPVPVGSVPHIHSSNTLTYLPNYPVLFVGDSRTVGMNQALNRSRYDLENISFLAQVGKGYSWLAAKPELTEIPPSIIILNLGVNDLGNLYQYEALYASYARTYWADCPVYIVSVNPCTASCTSVSNARIEAFNASMQAWIDSYNQENASDDTETFPIRYIDTYHYLLSQGFSSPDGLHYTAATYEKIYAFIINEIQESIGDGNGQYCYTGSS